ncbi:hypothetical protein BJI67_16140 (plasmid) [Acidihalobacter aeolianus]|uniref:Uncharacterized protein n=1 Tax=Acidihalobacter aeolianus TaxID=2792603 RepID=A0A1D8KCT5_9GAMM|nr:hypothetical protein [Acidihalobacter aeolianus]AOV18769.1 hypothetical protein BJI67_16140 [Acidihalobacter aeolianus]
MMKLKIMIPALFLALAAGSAVAAQKDPALTPTTPYQQQVLCTQVAQLNGAAYQMKEAGVPMPVRVAVIFHMFADPNGSTSNSSFTTIGADYIQNVVRNYQQTGKWSGIPKYVALAKMDWRLAENLDSFPRGENLYRQAYMRCIANHPIAK